MSDGQEIMSIRERESQPMPQIYVASLSDYVAGRLHGVWCEAAVEDDALWAGVQQMLQASPEPHAEEWAIHDYEGFGPLRLSEYENLETVAAIARGIGEHGTAFAHWASIVGTDDVDELALFDEAYRGQYDSVAAYAETLLDDLGYTHQLETTIPAYMQPYVKLDVEGFARDLELGGDITVSSDSDGDGVYIFEGGL